MRVILFIMLIFSAVWASEYKLQYWEAGQPLSKYLTKHKIDATKFYSKIDPDDIKYISNIASKSPFFERIKDGILQEALIPLGKEMQIHIARNKDKEYSFDIIPLKYDYIRDTVTVTISNNFFSDIKKQTNNAHIATYLKRIFKDRVDFTKFQKGDLVTVKYRQKSINGIPWEEPIIEAGYIKTQNGEFFALRSKDIYQIWSNSDIQIAKSVKVVKKAEYKRFSSPLSKVRVTSKFTYKRYHPILKRYRPHFGIDYGARRGTSIHAIASGKVIYSGWMGGYGKVIKIDHGNGVVSLYAHQSKLLAKRGDRVKRGQVIGKIGSTGRSTGPHLHLGLYKRGKPINPASYIGRSVKMQNAVTIKKRVKIVTNLEKELPLRAKLVYNSLKILQKNNYRWKSLDKTLNIVINTKERNNARRVKLSDAKGDA